MVSTFTTNKNIEKPANNDYVDTWNIPVNADWDIIDSCLGTTSNISLTNIDVTLSTAQYQSLRLNLTGTLTGNVNIIAPNAKGGMWIVYNNTSGSFTVTFKTAAGGSVGVTLVQGYHTFVVSNGTDCFYANDRPNGITNIATGTGLTGGPITSTGTISLANTAVAAGTYGGTADIPTLVIDAQGRITSATSNTVATLPSQTGNSQKVLTTNGSVASWTDTPTTTTTARAWVRFNGTTGTLIKSHNVSSVTRNGVGDYTIIFTTALPDANYCPVTGGQASGGGIGVVGVYQGTGSITTTSLRVNSFNYNSGTANDLPNIFVAVFD